jgi:hypothetical protein
VAKAILEFDLNDYDDRCAHKRATNATEAYIALSDIDELLRRIVKYEVYRNEEVSDEVYKFAENIRYDISMLISDKVNMNDLE